MLYRYLYNLAAPIRQIRSRWLYAKSMKAQATGDVRRVKGLAGRAKGQVAHAKGRMGAAAAKAGQVRGQAGQMAGKAGQAAGAGGQVMGASPQMGGRVAPAGQQAGGPMSGQPGFGGGAPGAPGMAGAPAGAPPGMGAAPGGGGGMPGGPPKGRIKRGGFLWLKRKCVDCKNKMEKAWDICPYCNSAPEPVMAPPPEPKGPMKTQAFQLNQAGSGNSDMALLGWLVPVRGPQRGELFTLASESLVGTDPSCTVVLHDTFMSSRHCEIKAEGGQWILKDLGSTNGTFVNDKRVDRHELVDSDFVKTGQSLLKFKCM